MKKILLLFFLLNAVFVYSFTVVLDLNQNTGNEPLDVNLSVEILDGTQTRTCIDLSECGTEYNKPEEIQACGSCTEGTTLDCTTTDSCPGIQSCNAGTWSLCNDILSDNCPATQPIITVKQITPIQDINVIQNQAFTFTTSVTCNDLPCGNITATLDPQETILIESGGKDTYLRGSQHTGTDTTVRLDNDTQRILMEFDVSGIPVGSFISKAEVWVYANAAWRGGDPIAVYEVLKEWGETASGWNAVNGANSDYAFYNSVAWSGVNMQAGTDYTSTPETIFTTSFNSTQNSYLVNITSLVQKWVEDETSNHGLVMMYDNYDGSGAIAFYSKNDLTASNRPKLFVDYSSSPPKGVVPMNSGIPFYTSSQNPQTCSNMLLGETCVNSWTVIPTGNLNTTYTFFVDYVPENPGINPKATQDINITILDSENCMDNDLDGFIGFDAGFCSRGTDCQDLNPNVNPGQTEICENLIDDNCNNETDETCLACIENWSCDSWGLCGTGIPPFVFEWDFEGDGVIDATTNTPNNSLIHTYSIGYYNPKIKVIDITTQQGEATENIMVSSSTGNIPPTADAGGPYFTAPGESITLDASNSYDLDGIIDQYKWKITDKIGNSDCNPKTSVNVTPFLTVVCNGIGTADVNLTIRDNGSPNREWTTNFTTITIKEIQTSDLINIVKMTIEPEIVKEGENIQVMTRIRSAINTNQEFNIYYSVKLNQADANISALPALITAELTNQTIEGFDQKDFIITITSAELSALKTGENYWIYAKAETVNEETNQTFNSRRATFSLNESRIGEVQMPETNFISLIIIVFSLIMILTKKQTIKKNKKQ